MRILSTVAEERKRDTVNKKAGFIECDLDNLYFNKAKALARSSHSAQNCLKTFVRFVVGNGFTDPNLNTFIVNKQKKLRAIDLLRKIVYDKCLLRGVSVHINYNGLGKKTTLDYVPFENCRLGKPDDTGYINNIITNKDFFDYKDSNNVTFFAYDLSNVVTQIAKILDEYKDIKKYRGQIYWYSEDGFGFYPLSTIDSVATDCSTEEGLQNIRYRNARFNFLPAGMLVKMGKQEENNLENTNPNLTREQMLFSKSNPQNNENSFESSFVKSQTDKNASKIILCEVNFGEEIPQFINFRTNNYDKEYTVTHETCKNTIGSIFNQPPVLRGDLIAGKLGTSQEMTDAYNIYNNWTSDDRTQVSEIFQELLSNFQGAEQFTDYSIRKLQFLQ